MLARRLCSIGIAPSARLRRAVPTRGRRSLAGASWCPWGYPPRCVARRLASRSEGERGAVAPLSHFPPDHAGSEPKVRHHCFCALGSTPPAQNRGDLERRSPTGIARERETRTNNAAFVPRGAPPCWNQVRPYRPERLFAVGFPPDHAAANGPRRALRAADGALIWNSFGRSSAWSWGPVRGPPGASRRQSRARLRRAAASSDWSLLICDRGAVAPLSHFPPDHAGSERSSLPLFLRARQYANHAESRGHGAPVSDRHRAGARNPRR